MTNPTNAERRNGLLEIAGGVAVLLFAWLVPYKLAETVARCNTVIGSVYADRHAKAGAACTAANFFKDYQWVFYLLGLAMIVVGGFTLVFASPRVRAFFDDED